MTDIPTADDDASLPALPTDAAMRRWAEELVARTRAEGVELTGEAPAARVVAADERRAAQLLAWALTSSLTGLEARGRSSGRSLSSTVE